MRGFRILAAALALSCLSASPAAERPASIPMRPYGTQPAVHVMVNGRGPYLFLIDTGAGGRARIDASVVRELAIPTAGSTTVTGAVEAHAPVSIARVRVDSLKVGSRLYAPVEALSRNYNDPDEYLPAIGGILAFNLFADQLLVLDFCHRVVRIEEGSLPPPNGRTIVPYEDRDGLPYVPITIGEVTEMALLDTGSDRALDLPTATIRRLYLASFPRPLGRSQGVTGTVTGIGLVSLEDDLVIGQLHIPRPEASFSSEWTTPLLGSALFRRHVLTFDQKHRRLGIRRPKGC